MSFLILLFLFFGVYSLFQSSDLIEMGEAGVRTLISILLLVCERFSEPVILQIVVLGLIVCQLAFLGLIRIEVQVKHDGN